MAATVITAQRMSFGSSIAGVCTGLATTFANATDKDAGGSGLGGDKVIFSNPSRGYFKVKNYTTATIYAKIVGQQANAQGIKQDAGDAASTKGFPVAAGATGGPGVGDPGVTEIGPLDGSDLRDSSGYITLQCSANGANVKIAAIELADKGRG